MSMLLQTDSEFAQFDKESVSFLLSNDLFWFIIFLLLFIHIILNAY